MTGLELAPGTVLCDYLFDKVLGAGGFGITYLAYHLPTGEAVAIKEYYPKSSAVRVNGAVWINDRKNEEPFNRGMDRFWKEAENLARFHHPHIVKVMQRFLDNGTAYIVLEFIDGLSLEQWAVESRGRPPTQDELDSFMYALTDALEAIHRNNFLHRDLAPKNILLLQTGLPVLIDFGSARFLDPSRNMTAMVTPNYAPYEQHGTSGQGQGPWTDIYGASATIYRVLMGRPPIDATIRALDDSQYVPLARQLAGTYRRGFLESLDWGLRVHYSDRPQNVADWRAAMLEGNSVPRGPSGLQTKLIRMSCQKPLPLLARLRRFLHISKGT